MFHVLVKLFSVLGYPAHFGHWETIVATFVFNVPLSLFPVAVGHILDWVGSPLTEIAEHNRPLVPTPETVLRVFVRFTGRRGMPTR